MHDLLWTVAYLLAAAKLTGEISERLLKQPAVLGELVGGMLAAPLLISQLGPDFAVEPRLSFLAEMAAVILLFRAGLETDVKAFIKAGPMALAIAVAGVVLPFIVGAYLTAAAGIAPSFMSPAALFVGAAMTATSVGITARVLGDLGAMSSRAGTLILAAAVIDDVLGILVVALLGVQAAGAGDMTGMLLKAGGALGGWIALTALCLAAAPVIDRLLRKISPGAGMAVNVALAFGAATVAQEIGLAPIIGAYAAGLGFAGGHVAKTMDRELDGVANLLVPLFFAFIGAQVNIGQASNMLGFGSLLLISAILTKYVGCGLAARALGASNKEATTIGIGMIPRGEVALVVAGMGIASGVITHELFSIIVLVALATTFVTPPLLAWAWRKQTGLLPVEAEADNEPA